MATQPLTNEQIRIRDARYQRRLKWILRLDSNVTGLIDLVLLIGGMIIGSRGYIFLGYVLLACGFILFGAAGATSSWTPFARAVDDFLVALARFELCANSPGYSSYGFSLDFRRVSNLWLTIAKTKGTRPQRYQQYADRLHDRFLAAYLATPPTLRIEPRHARPKH